MQHAPNIKKSSEVEAEEETSPVVNGPDMADRSNLRLSIIIGGLFSITSFLCLVGICFLTLFFVKIVAEGGEIGMIPIFTALGISLILGMLLLDATHAKSLAGYRASREYNGRKARAIAGGVLCLLIAMIHPIMALAILVSAAAGSFGHLLLRRIGRTEASWDFLPTEAISVLSGRDAIGVNLAMHRPETHAIAAPITRAGNALSVVVAMACSSYLISENIMTMTALVPLVIATLWASQEILTYSEQYFARQRSGITPATSVTRVMSDDRDEDIGLNVQGLNLRSPDGNFLMSDIDFHIEPGQITAIIGPSGAGKSLLLKAIVDPFSLNDVEVSGHVDISGTDLWSRRAKTQSVPVVFMPSEPLILPASGAENLSCFHSESMLARGKWFLERIVFAVDMVESICDTRDARFLPSMQRRALAFARAFLLSPPLYLLDRPEDGLPDKQIGAVTHRLKQETRMGRCVLMATNHRSFLDVCDQLLVIHQGRIVDYGPAEDVRRRMDSGWSRFIGNRVHETGEVLETWIRSHFFRDGDEANRRKVSTIASDMLALSCQTADARNPGQVHFEFKHFQGHCLLRMYDNEPPIGSSILHKAEIEAESEENQNKISFLGAIIRGSLNVEATSKKNDRELLVQIETYDPRKIGKTTNGG
jgi:ABC-type multidrug transport system ATPase subunit